MFPHQSTPPDTYKLELLREFCMFEQMDLDHVTARVVFQALQKYRAKPRGPPIPKDSLGWNPGNSRKIQIWGLGGYGEPFLL